MGSRPAPCCAPGMGNGIGGAPGIIAMGMGGPGWGTMPAGRGGKAMTDDEMDWCSRGEFSGG